MCLDAYEAWDMQLDVSLHVTIAEMTHALNSVVFLCTFGQFVTLNRKGCWWSVLSLCCLSSMLPLLMQMSSTSLVHMDVGLSDVSLQPGKMSHICCTFLLQQNCLALWEHMMWHISTAFVSHLSFVHPCGISTLATK